MVFKKLINGIETEAFYDDRDISELFLPLLELFKDLQEKKKGRLLVFLAAPPAAGKSTLAAFLEDLSKEKGLSFQSIGIDGFHRYQDDLLAHTTEVDGEIVNLVKIKGAPITFDLTKLSDKVKCLKETSAVMWPVYDRMKHNPTEDVIRVQEDIVLLEGNYLLLNQPGWKELQKEADMTIMISADIDELRRRLVPRHVASGKSPEDAAAFVESSDLRNARLVLTESDEADLTLTLAAENRYTAEWKAEALL